MKGIITTAVAAALLSTSAMATPMTDYLADLGSDATFADGVANGYFENTVDNRIEYFFASDGAVDTNAGVMSGYLNARGNIVYSLEATDYDEDIVLKYRPLQGNMRLEYNGNFVIGETVAHIQEWLAVNPEVMGYDDMDSMMDWLVDVNADFNRGEHWVATLTEAAS